MSLLPKFSYSAFGPGMWFPTGDAPLVGSAVKTRAAATIVDLSGQIVSYIGSYAALAFFLKPEDRVRFAILGVACLSATIGCRALSHTLHYFHEISTGVSQKIYFKRAEHIAYVTSHLFMAVFYVMTINRLVHELGRVVTSLALFNKPNPIIRFDFWSNRTDIISRGLTPIGEKIGWRHATALFDISGSIAVSAFDCSLVQYAHNTNEKDSSSSTQTYLRVALSSLRAFLPFTSFAQNRPEMPRSYELLGIHPIAVVIFTFTAPIFYQFALMTADRLHEEFVTKIFNPKPDPK